MKTFSNIYTWGLLHLENFPMRAHTHAHTDTHTHWCVRTVARLKQMKTEGRTDHNSHHIVCVCVSLSLSVCVCVCVCVCVWFEVLQSNIICTHQQRRGNSIQITFHVFTNNRK